jgi:hypothetical protein
MQLKTSQGLKVEDDDGVCFWIGRDWIVRKA